MSEQSVLIVFAKAPVAGQVKTRLIPELGLKQSLYVYERMLSRTVRLAKKSDFNSVKLFIDGNIRHSYFNSVKKRYGIRLYPQKGHDLGRRMFNAFQSVLNKYKYAVLIGSDCPGIVVNDLRTSLSLLKQDNDIVLGPANDGGYYLVGLKKNNDKLFNNIQWSTESVANETYRIVKELNWKLSKLPVHTDIDNSRDLRAYSKKLNNFRP